MPNVKNGGTRLTPITFQNEVRCDSSILQQSPIFASYHPPSLTNQEVGTIMINHFRPHPIGVNKNETWKSQ